MRRENRQFRPPSSMGRATPGSPRSPHRRQRPSPAGHDSASSSLTNRPRLPTLICPRRSEEHTSELQPLMRISYAVFCLKKKKNNTQPQKNKHTTTQTLRKLPKQSNFATHTR